MAESSTFNINLGGDARSEADRTADAMEKLRARIAGATEAIRAASSAQKNLRGATAEVKSVKDELKAKIEAERAAISAATLQLHKSGTSYEALSGAAKKAAAAKAKLAEATKKDGEKAAEDRLKGMSDAATAAKGPIESLKGGIATLKDMLGSSGLGAGLAFAAAGIVAVVAAALSLAKSIGTAAIDVAKFVLVSADAARSAGLMREAVMGGNVVWAKAFGEQVDALAKKVPTSKAAIDELGASLAKNRIGGQLWVDTMNAVAQASAALGDEAGNKLKSFIERGRLMGRLQINPMELIGSGLDFNDIAKSLAAQMHVGVNEAKAALVSGAVKLGDGAKAMRDAVEKKFGGINLRKMMSLDVLASKFHETLANLTKGVDLEPLLAALSDIASVFDTSKQSGNALKTMVTVIGKDLVGAIAKGGPVVKKFLYGLIIGALEVTVAYLKVRNSLRDTFSDSKVLKDIDVLSIALKAGELALSGMKVSLDGLNLALKTFVVLSNHAASAVEAIAKAKEDLLGILGGGGGWEAVGRAIIDGLVKGITSKGPALVESITKLADKVKTAFTAKMDIHSPSKVFEAYGRNTVDGYVAGIEKGGPDAQSAASGLAPGDPSGGSGASSMLAPSGAGASRGGSIELHLHFNVQGGGNANAVQATLSDPSFLERVTQAVVDGIHMAGAPT